MQNTGSGAGYRDMAEFIDTVTDLDLADRLGIAIQGRGAFRRFKDTLARWPAELERWYGFSDDRQRGRGPGSPKRDTGRSSHHDGVSPRAAPGGTGEERQNPAQRKGKGLVG